MTNERKLCPKCAEGDPAETVVCPPSHQSSEQGAPPRLTDKRRKAKEIIAQCISGDSDPMLINEVLLEELIAEALEARTLTDEQLKEIQERLAKAPKIGYLVTALTGLQGGDEAVTLIKQDIGTLLECVSALKAQQSALVEALETCDKEATKLYDEAGI